MYKKNPKCIKKLKNIFYNFFCCPCITRNGIKDLNHTVKRL